MEAAGGRGSMRIGPSGAVLTGGAVALGLYAVLPRESLAQAAVYLAVQACAFALLTLRVRRDRGTLPSYWRVLVAALWTYFAATVVWYPAPVALDADLPFPSFADLMFLVAYAGFAYFLVRLIGDRKRDAPHEARAAYVDAVIFAIAVGSLLWLVLVEPAIHASGVTTAAAAAAIAYPAVVALLFGLAARLAVATSTLRSAEVLVALWIGCELAGVSFHGYMSAEGTLVYGNRLFVIWLASFVVVAALAVHPGLPAMSAPRPARGSGSRVRLLAPMLAAGLLPLALTGVALEVDPHSAGGLLAAATATVALIMVRLILMAGDLGEQRRLAARLVELTEQQKRASLTDPLTGLGNRERLKEALSEEAATVRRHALIVVDLDGFKAINDTFGHGVGDETLRCVARRLQEAVRPDDLVLRLGSDEFAALLPGADADSARAVGERFLSALAQPLDVDGRRVFVRASAGIAAGEPGVGDDMLLRDADVAMYAVKSGDEPPGLAVFDRARHHTVLENLELAGDLGGAVDRGELELHYQPLVEMSTRRVVGCEALVRWRHPVHGWVQPGRFIPLAEANGRIIEIGQWVLDRACRQARRWQDALADPPYVSVNLSVLQLADPGFVSHVEGILAATELDPAKLIVELTETAMATEAGELAEPLAALRGRGIRVYMDDFGTGYSSLGQLRSLPLDGVKIDRSFIRDITSSADQWSVALTIVRMLRKLDLAATVEGVENAVQLAQVRSLGCDVGQGFHFARPMPADELSRLLGIEELNRR